MSRKAGSQEFKNELTKAQRNARTREEIANDPERAQERLSGVDRDKYDVSKYSDKDIIMAYQGGTFDENDYARLTGKGVKEEQPEETTTPNPTPAPTPTPTRPTGGGGNNSPVQTGTTSGDSSPVINQNTDGGGAVAVGRDNNGTIDNSVDNSRYYGGSSRTFNYKGGGSRDGNPEGLYDTPVSMATMAGYYDVDDSPAAGQAFLDRYITANNDAQRESDDYYNKNRMSDYRAIADSSRAFNPVAMQERLDREPLIDRERSKLKFGKLFGDMDNFDVGNFMMPKAPALINSNVKDIAEDYRSKM